MKEKTAMLYVSKKNKKALFLVAFAAAFFLFVPTEAVALEFSIAGGVGNAGYDSEGNIPHSILPNVSLGISGEMRNLFIANLVIEHDTVFGRKIVADATYDVGFFKLTAGPVFGFFNGSDGLMPSGDLLQPGLRLGVSLFLWDRILFDASSDFLFQIDQNAYSKFYPSQSRVALGFAFPSVVFSLEINQKSAVVSGDSGYSQTRTDYGLYTRVFDKQSPLRISLNAIYRFLDFTSGQNTEVDTSVQAIVLGGGVDLRIKMVEIFVNGEVSAYAFTDNGDNPFMFNAIAGVRINTR